MSLSQKELLDIATDEYRPNQIKGNKTVTYGGNEVISSTDNTPYQSNGLHASIVKKNGEKVVTFRGSQDMFSTEGGKDWANDLGLNNPNAYKNPSSQFKDADNWIASEQQKGHLPKDLSNTKFTGHSLGGALAQYEAVKNNGIGISFSGPTPFYMLTPAQRKLIAKANVVNYIRFDDMIPDLPRGVPTIGKRIFVKGRIDLLPFLIGAGGHDWRGFSIENGQLVEEDQIVAWALHEDYMLNVVPFGVSMASTGGQIAQKITTYQ